MLEIRNRDARRLWLTANLLANTPTGPLDVMAIIRGLGFLQIDTIRNVTRAHHHILWSRNQNYREHRLWPLLRERQLFEHFTHDASLIPIEILPLWAQQFKRLGKQAARQSWYQSGLTDEDIAHIRSRIETEGPLSTQAFDTRSECREMWTRPPHKKVLEQLWLAGELATSHREKFVKYYDLASRVFPRVEQSALSADEQADKLNRFAMERLWIATVGEVQRFWGAVELEQVRAWMTRQDSIVPVNVECVDGRWRRCHALEDIEGRLETSPKPTRRLRILNPFDPAIRDRQRLARLFGFDYRNEMFVPATKRRWGYYVYPLLAGDRFVGRLELKADRAAGWLRVTGFWPEPGVIFSSARSKALDAELLRLARFIGVSQIDWRL